MTREANQSSSGNVGEILKEIERYRGLYTRVAHKLGVDPSYVSRVARGERRSKRIEAALSAEIRKKPSR